MIYNLMLSLFQNRKLIFLCMLTTCCAVTLTLINIRGQIQEQTQIVNVRTKFLIDTSQCKIPNVDPFEKPVTQTDKWRQLVCHGHHWITYVDGTKLRLNWTAINNRPYNGDFQNCVYQSVFRHEPAKHHNEFKLSDFSEKFNDTIQINVSFIRVTCTKNDGGKIYRNYHSFILPDEKRSIKLKNSFEKYREAVNETMNVVMMGLDSVSRLNFIRRMPLTMNYLINDLQAVNLMGYNKVGDNTLVNIVPLTIGKFVSELKRNGTQAQMSFDQYDFIWKQFARKGYHTLFAEDAPDIGTFDYLQTGFHRAPTDYFNRVISVAMERDKTLWSHGHNCFNGKLETEITLKYLMDFLDMFKSDPYFAFAYNARLTHDYLQGAGVADMPYYKFLQEMNNSGHFSNTLLLFFSDHGMRYGPERKTYVGQLEERLPMMYLVFPKWFQTKYPKIMNNLRVNSKRLTTPFDIYETLSDILRLKNKTIHSRGISLFKEVPEKRSCDDAGIPVRWCTCVLSEQISVSSKFIKSIATLIIQSINKHLSDLKDQCELLSLRKIEEARQFVGVRVSSIEVYQLTVRASPSDALFESTIRYNTDHKTFSPINLTTISRINVYGSQSHCINDHLLEKCFCRQQV